MALKPGRMVSLIIVSYKLQTSSEKYALKSGCVNLTQ